MAGACPFGETCAQPCTKKGQAEVGLLFSFHCLVTHLFGGLVTERSSLGDQQQLDDAHTPLSLPLRFDLTRTTVCAEERRMRTQARSSHGVSQSASGRGQGEGNVSVRASTSEAPSVEEGALHALRGRAATSVMRCAPVPNEQHRPRKGWAGNTGAPHRPMRPVSTRWSTIYTYHHEILTEKTI